MSSLYDKRNDTHDESGLVCEMDGTESNKFHKRTISSKYNANIIGYMITQSFGFENPRLATNLTRLAMYNGNGFYLRSDNYIKKLPLFVAGKFAVEDNWYENGTVYKSADMGNSYEKNANLLKSCLIFTGLSYYNKCLSFHGSDGRDYQNELCFDTGSLASVDLANMNLDADEKELMNIWQKILKEAKQTVNYDSHWKYGVYQITKELNTYTETGIGKNKQREYDYPELNGDLTTLKTKLKEYYKSHITELMFQYELLK